MDQVALKTEKREEFGKEAAKRYRTEGLVPAVIYGKGQENVSFTIKENELIKCLNTEAKRHVIFNLDLGGNTVNALIKDVSKHAVTSKIRHVDFIYVDMNKEIETEVEVRLVGVSPGVKAGGALRQSIKKVKVQCMPNDIPQYCDVDISKLEAGSFIRISDVVQEKARITYPHESQIIVRVNKPRAK